MEVGRRECLSEVLAAVSDEAHAASVRRRVRVGHAGVRSARDEPAVSALDVHDPDGLDVDRRVVVDEYDRAAVRRERRLAVAAVDLRAGQVDQAAPVCVHHLDDAERRSLVLAEIALEHDLRAVGRPIRIHRVPCQMRELSQIVTVWTDGVDLIARSRVGAECDRPVAAGERGRGVRCRAGERQQRTCGGEDGSWHMPHRGAPLAGTAVGFGSRRAGISCSHVIAAAVTALRRLARSTPVAVMRSDVLASIVAPCDRSRVPDAPRVTETPAHRRVRDNVARRRRERAHHRPRLGRRHTRCRFFGRRVQRRPYTRRARGAAII